MKERKNVIHFGCFGAIRPMKNNLLQAVAAMEYANEHNLTLHFHINAGRVEQGGDNALKNIKALFADTRHILVEQRWMEHSDFLKFICAMDLGMQVSLSETYNIVTADFINQGIPVVVSEEIHIASPDCRVTANDVKKIKDKIDFVLKRKARLVKKNKAILKKNSEESKVEWLNFVHNFK